jgi:pimeloyl-ACP methyl ester carboxylesterase
MSRVRVRGYSQAAKALAEGNIFVELEGCTTTAIVICGSEDVVTPPDLNRQVAEAIPGTRLELVDRAGHQPYVETPDIFNALVDTFLDDQNGSE